MRRRRPFGVVESGHLAGPALGSGGVRRRASGAAFRRERGRTWSAFERRSAGSSRLVSSDAWAG
jgi:hypothetical protein